MSTNQTNAATKYLFPFILVTSLFFLWAFLHNTNPILIPHLKKACQLSDTQSSFIDLAVYFGYFLIAIPAGLVMHKFGYKKGILIGLCLYAAGALLFVPAASGRSYLLFLTALFILAAGATFLETVANPYMAKLGDEKTGARRLNFAQSFNGLAATLAPIIGARLILTKDYTSDELNGMTEAARKLALAAEASTVKMPYLILGGILLLVAVFFAFTKLPEVKDSAEESNGKNILHAFRHRHLSWAVAAQFFYVGAQVCVFSFFILYAVDAAKIDKVKAADYLGWGCGMAFMIGRFLGTFFMKYIKPEKLLTLYAFINIFLCLAAMFVQGMTAIYLVIGIAFFMSIMFPTIFALGIKDLGSDTKFGSSLIIMSIVGGALLPPVFARIADVTKNIQHSYIVPLVCFMVIVYFGVKGHRVKTVSKQ